ncbi:MAG: hypothetical protein U0995_10610 [Erythrobacter sp.]|nr:hypothetical protein [Erythrobacter sp.]MDZ4273134.1 hypothetical protein [Erythrobacter sp.]MDZ4276481.1 hypothetical protein [Erythrobacter sp.]
MKRAFILALVLALAGCKDEVAAPAEKGGEATGEVLGGDISDAMIPVEQLTSQAPLAPRAAQSAAVLDAEQPDVASEEAEAAPAVPAPEIAPEE